MKYLILTLFIVALLWIIFIAWHNRRKPLYDNHDNGSGSGSSDSIGSGSFSSCGGHDGGCGGGDGGGGGGD